MRKNSKTINGVTELVFENFKYRLEKSDVMEWSVQKTNRQNMKIRKLNSKLYFGVVVMERRAQSEKEKRHHVKKLKDSDFLEIE